MDGGLVNWVLQDPLDIDKLLQQQLSALSMNKDELDLLIRKILWNEMEVTEDDERITQIAKNIIIGGCCLYHQNNLDISDIRVLIDIMIAKNLIDEELLVILAYIILLKDFDRPDNVVDFMKSHMRDFGVNHFDFVAVLNIADKLGQDTSSYDFVQTKYSSIQQRPEYLDEIIVNSDLTDLYELQYWVDADTRELITTHILEKKLDFEFESYENVLDTMRKDEYLMQFPLSHPVVGDKISGLEPRTIDMMVDLNDVPQDYTMAWLPRFVYSKPELEENIRIYFPGGRHIGHSSIVVKSNFGSFMLDFGLSVVNTSSARWMPLMDKLDFILISHAHMDHSGSLPILYGSEKKLPWFGHEHTKVMTEMLWGDTRKITWSSVNHDIVESNRYLKRLISRGSIINTLANFNALELNTTKKLLPNISVTPHDAAHLFGSIGFDISIGGKRLLYTGDFNGDKGANFPTDADMTIFDSTYFERYQTYPNPEIGLKEALDSSSKILIPAFSMGRSQEILFKLKQLGAEKDWTIYLTGMGGRLANKLNITVGSSPGNSGGGVVIAPTVKPEEFVEKSIVIGGQGMLQAGTSRWLFEETKDDEDTSVILCGYQAPNSLGYHLLQEHKYLLGRYKQQIKRVKMSGHTTGETLDKFMDNLSNRKVMVHSPVGAYEERNRQDVEQPNKYDPFEV